MPWPRLKMLAGTPIGLLEDLTDALAKQVFVAKSVIGSRLPCTATVWPRVAQPWVQGNAPIEPDNVGAGFAHGRQEGRGCLLQNR